MHNARGVPLVACAGIGKRFGGQAVLDAVDLELWPGEVHVLAGENGAGKSTLMRILSGVLQPDEGTLAIDGAPARFRSVHEATSHGIAMIHQELSLAPAMSVLDNLFLGREPLAAFPWIDRSRERRDGLAALRRVGLDLDPKAAVGSLPMGTRQLVEIAKALLRDARVLIMDEPTSALTQPEVDRLFALVRELAGDPARPAAIVYISHRMDEIYALADRITVLRDGRRIVTARPEDLPRERLVEAMVGRAVDETAIRAASAPGREALALHRVSIEGHRGLAVRDVSLTVRRGEVLGLAGLQGSGTGELLHALFGDGRIVGGEVLIDGRPTTIGSPREAMRLGIALLTDDRKMTGLCQGLSVRANLTLPSVERLSPGGWMRTTAERSAAREAIASFGIRCRGASQTIRTLSGGNQQKVAFGKWLAREPSILLLHDPTRGVDVGARQEIYRLINDATSRGAAVLVTSSDLPELLGLADRVAVFHRGACTAMLERGVATPQAVIAAAMGERHG